MDESLRPGLDRQVTRRRSASRAAAASCLVALAGLVSACTGSVEQSEAEAAERWRREARRHLEVTGDVERALVVLDSLARTRPDDVEALILRGRALSSAPREWERAAGLFERAIELDPKAFEAHAGLFDATVRLGRLSQADAVRRRFARLVPDHPFPGIQEGRLAYLRGDMKGAERAFEQLASRFPQDRTVRAWAAEEGARLALVAGRIRDADRLLRRALAIASERGAGSEIVERALDRAWAMTWWSADTAAAIALVDSVTQEYPMDSMEMADWPFHYLAEFYALAGRPHRAVRILDAHASHMSTPPDAVPNPWWQAAWGLIALAVSQPDSAAERFRLWDSGIGCTVCALGDLARSLEASGQRDAAAAVWRRYLELPDPQRIEWDPYYLGIARERLIGLYRESGRDEEADELLAALESQWSEADPPIRVRLDRFRHPG